MQAHRPGAWWHWEDWHGEREGRGESEGHRDTDSGKPDSEVCRYRVTGHESHPEMGMWG